MNKKFIFILTIFVFSILTLIIRLYHISIKSNLYYEKLAKQNITKKEYSTNIRGSIFDANNRILAKNELGFSISISPHLSKKDLNSTIDKLTNIIPSLNKKNIFKKYRSQESPYSHKDIKIVDLIKYKDIITKYPRINIIKNLSISPTSKRKYPYKELASHIIGYTSPISVYEKTKNHYNEAISIIGKSGIEKYYEIFLRGELNVRKYKANAKNEEIEEIEEYISTKNTDITLTLDIRLQKFIHKYFSNKKYHGVAIVMNSQNGDILSAVSEPEYDLNLFSNGISTTQWKKLIQDINKPFTNKLTHGLYPPGSIVKLGVGLSFLQNGISQKKSTYCTGEFIFANQKFRCWKQTGHKHVNLKKAITQSCDDYFYKNSYKVGIDKISQTLKILGLGQKTLIDLPNEFKGTIPNKQWKRNKYNQTWYVGETFISSIGQGFNLVTPMQIVKFLAFISNGHDVVPHFIKKIGDYSVKYEAVDSLSKEYKKNLIPIRRAMFSACNTKHGTGYKYVRHSRYALSCKTGTAQVSRISHTQKKRLRESQLKYLKRSHAWFVSFFPKKNPKYIIVVLVEHGGYGSKMGTIAADIVNYMRRLGYVK